MRTFYRWLLRLYPLAFRLEFAQEMEGVFADVMDASRQRRRWPPAALLFREFSGIIRCAMHERLIWYGNGAMPRRFNMKHNRFHFSWAAVGFMTLSLAIVLYIIREGRAIANSMAGKTYVFEGHTYAFYGTGHLSFLQTFGFAFAVTVACTLIVLVAMNSLRRLGVHRMEDAKTWPLE